MFDDSITETSCIYNSGSGDLLNSFVAELAFVEWFALICHCEERSDVAPPPTTLCNLAIQDSEQIKPAPVMGAGGFAYRGYGEVRLVPGPNIPPIRL